MHNNLYKYPQQIISITFLKSERRVSSKAIQFNPIEFDYYTEPKLIVNIYFRKALRDKNKLKTTSTESEDSISNLR